ncbi:hypothetical protein NM688_g8733 [Phlebia brevispora]|uniref:Uncharacterized protein n=1 Tax=Phlebia brevispora TaxID=194682 RepID=A0ACC1RS34_9APHY|nr:hypothetical protein NM688_g8733 [Phlebia brevispora]
MQSTSRRNEAGWSDEQATRFTVQSSDVISDMRINVFREGSETVQWYKERFLGDEEIIDHIVENATSTIQWSVHRPKRGWYLRIRSPLFPPGSFVNLAPLPQSSPYHSDAALAFACRTNPQPIYKALDADRSLDSEATLTDGTREVNLHSYPPTPPQNPTVRMHPPSPHTIQARLSEIRLSQSTPANITHFLLTPHSNAHAPTEQPSLFARMVSAIKNAAPSHSSSFTMSPIPPPSSHPPKDTIVPTPVPLLKYHDRTPMWTANATYGTIEIDRQREQDFGVQASFWVAVALTYLDFLTEREVFNLLPSTYSAV